MTNYNLQEFKQWLEEKPERKAWFEDYHFNILPTANYWKELIAAAKGMTQPGDSWTSDLHKKHRQAVQEWISQTDRRKREQRGGIN